MSETRREFLALMAAATTAALADAASAGAAEFGRSGGLVDVNVNLSRWPLRRLPADQPEQLVRKLRSHGVTQAWASSFDSLLHRDLGGVNARLAADCREHGRGFLLPFGSIDPTQSDWEEELRRCALVHRMPGVRLHPNYHGYQLDDARFVRLLKAASEQQLVVQIAVLMEDERMMHPLLRVPTVDTKPLAPIVAQMPGLRLVLLNALGTLRGAELDKLLKAGNVSVEVSTLEGVGGIERLLDHTPASRLLFGSYAPYFYFEAAELKLKESALSPEQLRSIRLNNAKRLLSA